MDAIPDRLLQLLRERGQAPRPTDEQFGPTAFHPPLSAEELAGVEQRLAFDLPQPVKQVWGTVANGGFGPGYGLIGLVGGALSDLEQDAVEDYLVRRGTDPEDPGWYWPHGVLPICHWGCAIYSCVDCNDAAAPVLRFDPNIVDRDWSVAWGRERDSLRDWLSAWIDGEELFASGTPLNAYRDGG